jgi:germination protein M
VLISVVVMVLGIGTACQKKEVPPPAQQNRISATKAYEKYFGPAPTTDKGTCYAFVIYFPSARDPGKVVPFPFFTFDEGSMEKVAVERLLAGMEVPAYGGEISQPFAPTARLLALEQVDGLKRVDLSGGFLTPGTDRDGMLHALVMTLTQFPMVRGVRLLQEGKDLDYARGPQKPDGSWVLEPGPPRLLSVTATKEKGAKDVEDVNAYFDRPVAIREFSMSDRQGKSFAGETFQSVFDMAVVLKPADPALFKAQMPIKVRWKVTDKLGRQGEGNNVWFLEVKEH